MLFVPQSEPGLCLETPRTSRARCKEPWEASAPAASAVAVAAWVSGSHSSPSVSRRFRIRPVFPAVHTFYRSVSCFSADGPERQRRPAGHTAAAAQRACLLAVRRLAALQEPAERPQEEGGGEWRQHHGRQDNHFLLIFDPIPGSSV